jgi:hypothetical protein
VFWNTHTRRLGNTEVQVLSCKEVLPHVEEMPGPEQAPRRAVNGAGNGQVGVCVCRARAVSAALGRALVEAFGTDVHKLVRNLHLGQGHKIVTLSAFQLLLPPASSGGVEAIDDGSGMLEHRPCCRSNRTGHTRRRGRSCGAEWRRRSTTMPCRSSSGS